MSQSESVSLPPPSEWGPKFWYVMELVAQTYGDRPSFTQRSQTRAWFVALKQVLPCPECRAHYTLLLQQSPIDKNLDNSSMLLEWVKHVKEEVSRTLASKQANTTSTSSNVMASVVTPPVVAAPVVTQPKSQTFRRRLNPVTTTAGAQTVRQRVQPANVHKPRAAQKYKPVYRKRDQRQRAAPPTQAQREPGVSRQTAHARARLAHVSKNYRRPCSCG